MDRRVRAGMALELVGTQASNLLFHTGPDVVSSFSNVHNVLVLVHIFAVWKYAAFTLDHLLSRHVTRIALLPPAGPGGAPVAGAAGARAAGGAEPLTVLVETGPWSRRLELRPAAPEAAGPCLGLVVEVGALHVDRARGEVLDAAGLASVLAKDLRVTAEELVLDEAAARRALLAAGACAPSMEEITGDGLQWLADRPWLLGPLQWPGSAALVLLGYVAMAMGAGTVLLWTPLPGMLGWGQGPGRRRHAWGA